MRSRSVAAVGLVAAVCAFAASAHAGITTYSSLAAYQTGTSGAAAYAIPARTGSGDFGASATIGAASFYSADLTVYDDGQYGAGLRYLGATANESGTEVLTVIPSSTATNFAFELGTYDGADQVAVTVNGQNVASIVTNNMTPTFFGVSDSAPIASLTFTTTEVSPAGPIYPEIDVISAYYTDATPSSVPEPGMLSLLAFGLFAVLRARRT